MLDEGATHAKHTSARIAVGEHILGEPQRAEKALVGNQPSWLQQRHGGGLDVVHAQALVGQQLLPLGDGERTRVDFDRLG